MNNQTNGQNWLSSKMLYIKNANYRKNENKFRKMGCDFKFKVKLQTQNKKLLKKFESTYVD